MTPPVDTTTESGPKPHQRSDTSFWLSLTLALAYAGYFVLRYGGLWAENDSAVFSQVTTETLQHGSIFVDGQYPHGFGYPSWLAGLSLLTGLSPPVLNSIVLPYVGGLFLMLPAFLAYRALLRSGCAALLAAGLLLPASDLMFSALRGNHEKLNIAFMLAGIYVLFQGFAVMRRRDVRGFATWVVLFYILVLSDAVVNDFFASTLVTATTLTLASLYGLISRREHLRTYHIAVRRYATTVAISWLIVWWAILFLFPPAGHDLKLVTTVGERLRNLFLTLQSSSNPYTAVNQQWASISVALAIACFRWLLFAGSFVIWGIQSWRLLRGRVTFSLERLFLLALYGSFGIIVAVSIPVDFSGLYAGANLELRNFSFLALLATPLFTWGIRDLVAADVHRQRRSPLAIPLGSTARMRTLYHALSLPAVAVFALLLLISALKTTLDPTLSNQWILFSSDEARAVRFFTRHAPAAVLWTGPDYRLSNMAANWFPDQLGDNRVEGTDLLPFYRNLLRSPQVVTNLLAQGKPIPDYDQQNRVYDNGSAEIYHLSPLTIFQR